jgi:ubiquinol-cytochrome c reductase cytochrome b subunit
MNILLVLHLMQVVIDGAYKAPREVNFWFGIGLLLLVLGLSLTGYLLPWDQKGYWATKVATSIAAITPFIGPEVQKLIVGGAEYGHHTLTRFFALHAGVLPAAIVVLVVGHVYLFRRHGLTPKEPRRGPDEAFWPDQVLKDAVACLAVLAVVLFLTIKLGVGLSAPADPAENYAAARPEWYFLFLFELLKYFPGEKEIIGAMILPGFILTLVCLMPFIGRWRLGHTFNVGLSWCLIFGVGLLTWLAIQADRNNPTYVAGVAQAKRDAERVKILARAPEGISSEGAVALLRRDPFTQGPKLFARHCASCHRYDGHDGMGSMPLSAYTVQTNETLAQIGEVHQMSEQEILTLNELDTATLTKGQKLQVHSLATAADLKGFGSREWLAGLLDPEQIGTRRYFGGSRFNNGKMAKFVRKQVAKFSPEQQQDLVKVLAAVSAEGQLKSQRTEDARDAALIAQGRELFHDEDSEMGCVDCHQFREEDEDATAPDLTGYGSREWLIGMISDPAHERFYGRRNDKMPRFGEEKLLNAETIGLIADWLRGDWYEPANSY